MNEIEAIKYIQKLKNMDENARMIAVMAIKYRIPQKMTDYNCCPVCGRYMGSEIEAYCHSCGKKILIEDLMENGDG